MVVSIVIVSFNSGAYLRRCLASLDRHVDDIESEVIVVDNASTDDTQQVVRHEFPHVKLLARADNAGFSRAINEGIASSRGEYLFILNPDSELLSNVLPVMIAHLREHPDIALLGPKILESDGTLQLSCRAFPDFSTAIFNRYSPVTRMFPTNKYSSRYLMLDFDHARIADVDWMSGACWLMPRAAFETIGPLDERYFWTFEDVDYCQRAKRAGLRVVYFPDVSIVHHIGGSSKSTPIRAIIARHQGMWRYYRSYMQPANTALRALVNSAIALAIGARCTVHLATSAFQRSLARASA
jgi:GT2 family glycosyltransferase